MEVELIFIITIVVLLNIIVMLKIIPRNDLETAQKLAQTLLVWILPMFGAVVIWLFYRSVDKPIPKPVSYAKKSEDSNSWQDTP